MTEKQNETEKTNEVQRETPCYTDAEFRKEAIERIQKIQDYWERNELPVHWHNAFLAIMDLLDNHSESV